MFAKIRQAADRRGSGFTLIELITTLAILGILVTLALPAYVSARKSAYRGEADNLLQEIKTMEWAYYQRYNLFDVSGTSIGFIAPGGVHWAAPAFSGDATRSVQVLMSGCGAACSPIGAGDRVSLVLTSDGSSTTGSSF